MGSFVHVEKNEHVATVALTRPTMPPAFFDELGETFRELAGDANLRAVVLRSDSKGFSYGLDLNQAVQELLVAVDNVVQQLQALQELLEVVELLVAVEPLAVVELLVEKVAVELLVNLELQVAVVNLALLELLVNLELLVVTGVNLILVVVLLVVLWQDLNIPSSQMEVTLE